MSSLTGPKPVSLSEFRHALDALCPRRLPAARHVRPRRIALAVSGGVDSMAMAHLFSSLLSAHPRVTIADHPVHAACAIVVDHQLRPGSSHEAACVAAELRRMRLEVCVRKLDWARVTARGLDPARLSNLEGLARTMRYQALGLACRVLRANGLFFAHHSDDQYETVLMRLLAGHGYRGLRGVKDANAIPECYELHRVYKSGLLDDQVPRKSLGFRPGPSLGLHPVDGHLQTFLGTRCPHLTPLECEDGGVVVYRPLLAFDKDRLVATCQSNGVRWFEDHTNLDPSLTTRNAIRHLSRSHRLPLALQKPAILSLSERARRRAAVEEAEARRLLLREAVVCRFDPNVGTLTVKLPVFTSRPAPTRRLHDAARRKARTRRRRVIVAIAVRKLIDFVTPELHLPPLANLDNVVDRLFPQLCAEPSKLPPKAFSIAGIKLEPVDGHVSAKWFLSRTPFPSSRALPTRTLHHHTQRGLAQQGGSEPPTVRRGRWRSWDAAQLWDGRFWIRVRTCTTASFRILPFLPEHAKPFRQALPREEQSRLERVLRRHAPGKVRYSLPALYAVEQAGTETEPSLTLLALPSLGIHVGGLERWVQYEVRYKSVDKSLLDHGPRTPGGARYT